ncbi:Fur family transcriptional regulator [Erythrobacter sp. QSSC1-22B]|uniref:Fur family transcriptional regulator n=1 Tax=Erythrobacter sp. QSSC1-22B TaxID=1860125 RepID=UPI00143C3A8C|nr:transcriptional repressor [Erythrobacter sp. QSSC1-22B]
MHEGYEWKSLRHRALIACDQAGIALTPLREAVLHGLWKARSPRSAYELISELSEAQGRRIGPNSAYRILKLLSAAGLVRRVESKKTYCLSGMPDGVADILITCDGCGHVIEVSAKGVRNLLDQCSDTIGFQLSARPTEIAGRCHDCD